MNLRDSPLWITTMAVAFRLLLRTSLLISVQIETGESYTFENCDAASLGGIQNGSRPTNLVVLNRTIEVEFKLYFGCQNPPTLIDQGVRLEVRLLSAVYVTDWRPIRYYAPSDEVPVNYSSLVEFDPLFNSVTAIDNSSVSFLPFLLISSSQSAILIREYICSECIPNFTKDLQLELRWLQHFGRGSESNYSRWIIDDISIRIWNGKRFLQVLNQTFNKIDMVDFNCSYCSFKLAKVKNGEPCMTLETNYYLQFEGEDSNPTTRSLIIKVTNISEFLGVIECDRCVEVATKLLKDGFSEMILDRLIEECGLIFSEEVIDIVINSITETLIRISMGTDYEAGGIALEALTSFAFKGFDINYGKVYNDIYTLQVEQFSPDDYNYAENRLTVLQEPEGSIILPGELFLEFASDELTDIRVAAFLFNDLSGILPQNTEDEYHNTSLGSPVLSASLLCMGGPCNSSDLQLKNPVLLQIHHFKNLGEKRVFFPLPLTFPSKCTHPHTYDRNVWSSRGCKRISNLSNASFSVCESYHLTPFAILLSPRKSIQISNPFALMIIDYVGVTFSLISMTATIFILAFCKSQWGMRSYIRINLCLCLIISQVIFISAVDKTAMERLCQAIAIVLHYFFLTTFMWMLMEGVLLYIMLIRVFIERQYLYIIGFTVVSYGLPALYVFCVTMPIGLTVKNKGRPQYGSSNESKVCWLRSDTHFNWAFITPVIIIIVANIGFLIMTISIMWKHERRGTGKSKYESASHWLKTVISLMVVMGITWIIGVLVFHKSLIFVAYIFDILVAFQGTFIFILFVVMSKQIRESFKKWWREMKGESELLNKFYGWNKSSKQSQSTGSLAMKKNTPQIQLTNTDHDKAVAASVLYTKVDDTGDVSAFEGGTNSNYANLSDDPEKRSGNISSSQGTKENHMLHEGHMTK